MLKNLLKSLDLNLSEDLLKSSSKNWQYNATLNKKEAYGLLSNLQMEIAKLFKEAERLPHLVGLYDQKIKNYDKFKLVIETSQWEEKWEDLPNGTEWNDGENIIVLLYPEDNFKNPILQIGFNFEYELKDLAHFNYINVKADKFSLYKTQKDGEITHLGTNFSHERFLKKEFLKAYIALGGNNSKALEKELKDLLDEILNFEGPESGLNYIGWFQDCIPETENWKHKLLSSCVKQLENDFIETGFFKSSDNFEYELFDIVRELKNSNGWESYGAIEIIALIPGWEKLKTKASASKKLYNFIREFRYQTETLNLIMEILENLRELKTWSFREAKRELVDLFGELKPQARKTVMEILKREFPELVKYMENHFDFLYNFLSCEEIHRITFNDFDWKVIKYIFERKDAPFGRIMSTPNGVENFLTFWAKLCPDTTKFVTEFISDKLTFIWEQFVSQKTYKIVDSYYMNLQEISVSVFDRELQVGFSNSGLRILKLIDKIYEVTKNCRYINLQELFYSIFEVPFKDVILTKIFGGDTKDLTVYRAIKYCTITLDRKIRSHYDYEQLLKRILKLKNLRKLLTKSVNYRWVIDDITLALKANELDVLGERKFNRYCMGNLLYYADSLVELCEGSEERVLTSEELAFIKEAKTRLNSIPKEVIEKLKNEVSKEVREILSLYENFLN